MGIAAEAASMQSPCPLPCPCFPQFPQEEGTNPGLWEQSRLCTTTCAQGLRSPCPPKRAASSTSTGEGSSLCSTCWPRRAPCPSLSAAFIFISQPFIFCCAVRFVALREAARAPCQARCTPREPSSCYRVSQLLPLALASSGGGFSLPPPSSSSRVRWAFPQLSAFHLTSSTLALSCCRCVACWKKQCQCNTFMAQPDLKKRETPRWRSSKYQEQERKRSKSAGAHPLYHFRSKPHAKVQLGRELLLQSSAELRVFFQPSLVTETRTGIFPAATKLA